MLRTPSNAGSCKHTWSHPDCLQPPSSLPVNLQRALFCTTRSFWPYLLVAPLLEAAATIVAESHPCKVEANRNALEEPRLLRYPLLYYSPSQHQVQIGGNSALVAPHFGMGGGIEAKPMAVGCLREWELFPSGGKAIMPPDPVFIGGAQMSANSFSSITHLRILAPSPSHWHGLVLEPESWHLQ